MYNGKPIVFNNIYTIIIFSSSMCSILKEQDYQLSNEYLENLITQKTQRIEDLTSTKLRLSQHKYELNNTPLCGKSSFNLQIVQKQPI